MSDSNVHLDRLHELLSDRATQGLLDAERQELDRLLDADDSIDGDDLSMDLAAAAAALALESGPLEEMPAALRAAVETDAVAWLANSRGLRAVTPPIASVPAGSGRWLPWLAAAAGILLALVAWWPGGQLDSDELFASADTRYFSWADNDQQILGDVVWSQTRQEGLMRFQGLPVNDSNVEQYQLWIFDSTRDERYPIDGGVFDVDKASGEVIVPIKATLQVRTPTLFAVTVEKPGGVMVSDRTRLILAAPVGQ